jgi:hypothetical protein
LSVAARRARRNGGDVRPKLRARLEARRSEIEAAALTRIAAIADPAEVTDPAYADGLRRALPAAISFGIETIDSGEGHRPPIPVDLLAQSRLAARNRIPLDTVLRRYFAGYSLLGFHLLEEASRDGLMDGADLQRLVAAQSAHFDRLLAAVADEHARESETLAISTGERRRAERIERLLAGEPIDTSQIPYDFEGWHVGVAAASVGGEGGDGAVDTSLRELAARLDCRVLVLAREDGMLWAWLGSRRRLDPAELLRALAPEHLSDGQAGDPPPAMALGEPAENLAGWRFTHRQADAALRVARRGPKRRVRYADVTLLAAALQDDLLATSLRRLYIEPLENGRDGGAVLRETLRAYAASDRNLTATAVSLGVNRSTVSYRLQTAESRLGRPVVSCMAELEIVLA